MTKFVQLNYSIMRRNIVVIFLILSSFSLFSQNLGLLGGSYSLGTSNTMFRNAESFPVNEGIAGAGVFSMGIDYYYPINNWLSAESGLNYAYESFSKKTVDLQNEQGFSTSTINVHLMTIPVGLRASFLKYGFVESGALLDLLYEPGIGSYFGFGAQFQSEYGLGLTISPMFKLHSLFPLNFNANSNRILERGIKIGLTYSIDYYLKNRKKK